MYEDRSGTIWVGTVEGLDRFDRPTQSFEHFRNQPGNPNSLSGNSITQIFEDSQGMLWVGTWTNGLNHLNRSREKITRVSFVSEGHKGYENSVYAIHEDRSGTLWTATWRGDLYRYDREAEKFRVIPVLHNIGAMCIHEDPKGRLWFGTQDRGLICFSPSRGIIVSEYDIEEGLPSNTVYGILPDDQQHLWLSTNKGLCRLDPQTGQVKKYDISDGLPSNTFNWNGACRTPDGTLFFGSNEGLVHFPGDIIENEYPPRSYITRVRILSRSPGVEEELYNVNPSNQSQVLRLPYSRRDLVFEYLGLHYTNPSKNQYRYKLEPYETEWIPAGTQRKARYTNLSPGRYTFRMQAANSDGYWSETPAVLELIIPPPWWRTLPAFVLYALAGGGLLWLVYRILIERERQRNEIRLKAAEAAQLREVDQMKSRFFANISHEFRTPLTLIQGPVRSLLEGSFRGNLKNQYHLILRNTERLRHLIDQLLDLSRIESGKAQLELEAVDLVILTHDLQRL